MANVLQAVVPRLLAHGQLALRTNCVAPAIVNRDYGDDAKRQGQTIDVPIPSEIVTTAVNPGPNPPTDLSDLSPSYKQIELKHWEKAGFVLDDKEMREIQSGQMPVMASAAIASLCEKINSTIYATYTDLYGVAGTAGTTPFGNEKTTDINTVNKILLAQKCPMNNRSIVLGGEAWAQGMEIRALQDISWGGSPYVLEKGDIRDVLGFSFYVDQQIPEHTTGATGNWLVNTASTKGSTTIKLDGGTGTPKKGDVFSVAGNTQTYVITAWASGSANIYPALEEDAADNAAVTFIGDHVVNLAVHRNCIAFATRPLADTEGLGNLISSLTDEVSGLTLRLEVERQHKRTAFVYDMLWGVSVIRPELGCRLLG